jgi:flagellar hook-associated protein 3 FlgL
MLDNMMAGMSGSAAAIQKHQTQLATGKRVNRPVDDPGAVVRILSLRSGIRQAEQYLSNMAQAQEWLTVTELGLSRGAGIVAQAKECAQRGASTVLTQDGREAIARELDELLNELLNQANIRHGDRYVFAGTRNTARPYEYVGDPPASWTFSGDETGLAWEVEPGVVVNVSTMGESVFGGGDGAFAVLMRVRDNLRSGNVEALSTSDLVLLERAHSKLLAARADIGAHSRGLEESQSTLMRLRQEYTSLLSGYEDTDMAEAIMRLQIAETSYAAAQGAIARMVRPTLVDLLR